MRRIRNTYQEGWLERRPTKSGEGFFYRTRVRKPGGGYVKKTQFIGLVSKLQTEAQARKAADAMRLSANADNPKAQVVTFGMLVDRYIAEEMQQRLSTRTFYLPWFNNYIKPEWGDYPIDAVEPFAVRQWLNKLPLKKKSKQHIRSLMKQVFSMAMLWKVVALQINPMTLVTVRAAADEDTEEKRVLAPTEFQALLDRIPEPYRMMCIIACVLGLRVSEILGLRWGDFAWDRLEVHIQRAVVLGQAGRVKTAKSKSRMPLDPDFATMLLDFQRRTAPDATPESWVFANPTTGKPWRPSRIQSKYIRPAGLEVTGVDGIGWHNFRHTFSTMLRDFGTDVKVQQELMRHADVRTTLNIYTQGSDTQKREAVGKVARMVLANPSA